MSLIRAGVCIGCGCTQDKACVTDGMPCVWVNGSRTKCSACFTELGNPTKGFSYGKPKKRRRPGKRS